MKTVLLLSVLSSTVLGQQPASPDEKASIEGTVVNEVTGAPVKKAEVTVQFPPTTAITDASGHFAIDGLPPGGYVITVRHRSFLPGKQRARGQEAGIDDLTLRPGEKRKDIRIGLAPGVAISGRVLDEAGEPVRGCRVLVLQPSRQRGKRVLLEVTPEATGSYPMDSPFTRYSRFLTNDRGEYQFFNLPAKPYYLLASCQSEFIWWGNHKEGQLPTVRPFGPKDAPTVEQTYEDQFYPGTPNLSGATKLNPTPGTDMRDVNFRVRKVRAASVHGRLSHAGGSGSNEAILVVVYQRNEVGRMLGPKQVNVELSGEFEIRGLQTGSYLLSAQSFDDVRQIEGSSDIEVGDLPVKDLVIPVNEGVVVTGKIEWETPLQRAPLPIRLSAVGEYTGFREAKAEIEQDGSFRFPSVAPGVWELIHYGLVPPGSFIKSLRLGDQEVSPHHFAITPGATGSLKLLIGSNGAEIDGTVRADKSQDNGGIVVALLPEGGVPSQEDLNQTGTDNEGHFKLAGLPPGRYHLYAIGMKELPSEISTPDLIEAIESHGEEVAVEEGEHLTKELKVIASEVIEEALKALE